MPRMRNPDLNQSEHLNNMKRKEPLKNKGKYLISLFYLDIKNKQKSIYT